VRIVVAAVGAPRSPELAAAIRDYEARAARYWPLEIREVREASAKSTPPDIVRAREGERLRAAAGSDALMVACDAGGDLMDSIEFAHWLGSERVRAARDVVFLIGGALGLAADVLSAARRRLALARWTLPHEMARLVLAEQLYRAGTILRGEPYHK
jgi:23S rRNA (pseudouridine1915-N3)-methyltransferase